MFICLFLHQTTTARSISLLVSRVFICLFLHQTTTVPRALRVPASMFICLFLHQTTTGLRRFPFGGRCLSVYSYIKPQLTGGGCCRCHRCLSVYSYIKPQLQAKTKLFCLGVYLSIPTSNHNGIYSGLKSDGGVYLSIPTSNHNSSWCIFMVHLGVYLSIPTSNHNIDEFLQRQPSGVYLSIPTSNHNRPCRLKIILKVFICLFLHQTTTSVSNA